MEPRPDLVRLAQSGDTPAARSLVEKNYPAVYRLAFSILDEPVQATLAAHEAGMAQLENLEAYPGPEGYTAWLYRITLQVCRKRLRSRRMQEMLGRLPFMRQKYRPGEPAVKAAEGPDRLVWAAAQLEEKQRLVMVLRYGHDLLPSEIGQVLNWRESSVQARLGQARQSLRRISKMDDPIEGQPGAQSDLSHQQAEKYIEEAADHAITDADAARLERHLKECPRCVEAAQRLQKLENELRGAFHARWMVENPPTVGEISTALDQRRQRRMRLRTLSLSGGLVFTLFVIGLIIYLPGLYPARPAAAPPAAPPAAKATPTEDNVYVPPELPQRKDPVSNGDLLAGVYPGKLAFVAFNSLSDHLFTFLPGTRDLRQFTAGFADDSAPVWSPDGTRVAYLSVPGGGGANHLYVADADGNNIRAIPLPDFSKYMFPTNGRPVAQDPIYPHIGPPHWSPDGHHLAMAVWVNASSHFLAILPVEGPATTVLAPVTSVDPTNFAWSPDGSAIAFLTDSQSSLFVWWPGQVTRIGVNPRQLDGAWDDVFGLTWSPDSSQVAVLGGLWEGNVMQTDLHLIDTSGKQLETMPISIGVLTRSPTHSSDLAWSPDGRYLALIPVFTNSDLVYGRILLIRAGGKSLMPALAEMDWSVTSIAWSPDGQWLAYSTGYEMWVASIAAYESGQPPLARLSGTPGSELSWQPLPKEQ